jgi:hypothetical protein
MREMGRIVTGSPTIGHCGRRGKINPPADGGRPVRSTWGRVSARNPPVVGAPGTTRLLLERRTYPPFFARSAEGTCSKRPTSARRRPSSLGSSRRMPRPSRRPQRVRGISTRCRNASSGSGTSGSGKIPRIERALGWPPSTLPGHRSTWRTPPESSAASPPPCSKIRLRKMGDLNPCFQVASAGRYPLTEVHEDRGPLSRPP